MPIEVAPPKYVVLVNAVQARIADGTYPVGSKIPSEAELVAEFAASRPVVVRALGILAQDGWIESVQGLGRFVRGVPATAGGTSGQVAVALDREEAATVTVVSAGPVLATTRVAEALRVAEGTPVIARRRLVGSQIGPVELTTVYMPVEKAAGTGVGRSRRIGEGLLTHLGRAGLDLHEGRQRVSARPATAEEARLLEIGRRECVLVVLVVVHDRAGDPVMAMDSVIPPTRHELESTFPIG